MEGEARAWTWSVALDYTQDLFASTSPPILKLYSGIVDGGCVGKMSVAPGVVVYRQAQGECMGVEYVYFARRRRACLS